MYEHLIVVRNTIAFVLVMRESELVACSYTTDRATLLNLDEYCVATFHRLSRFLAPLEPAMLKKSSLHVDFYMQDWGRIMLYGAPSLFFPLMLYSRSARISPPAAASKSTRPSSRCSPTPGNSGCATATCMSYCSSPA